MRKDIMTKSLGQPISNDNVSLASNNGNILLRDTLLVEKLAHFNRERLPERVVHAKGWGAHGYFQVEHDITNISRACIFEKVGKKTPIFMRFSTVGGSMGSSDTARDPRGFAIKFYTEDGILDIVGNNTAVFFINDPIKFPDFIHSQKKNPTTNLTDYNAFWDFLSLTPESIHQVTVLFTDRGTPQGFRHMDGFGTDTFTMDNNNGQYVFVKFHFKTDQGIRNYTNAEAAEMDGIDPDSSGKDLVEAIAKGDFPSWKMYIQVMTAEEAKTYRFDPFDTTKVWFHKDYPLIPVGRIKLDRNVEDFFAEVEQSAFCPSNMIMGIGASQDKMLQGRMFAYSDTQRYRLGVNSHEIPINASKSKINNFQRAGNMTITANPANTPNYFPNSFDNTRTDIDASEPPQPINGYIERHPKPEISTIDFEQAGELYRRVLTQEGKTHLVDNVVGHLGHALKRIQYRQVPLFYLADAELGTRIANGLGLNVNQIFRMSKMTQQERVALTKG